MSTTRRSKPMQRVRRRRAVRPLVVLDNYDSFTWNLVQALGALGAAVTVLRNDAVRPVQLLRLQPCGLVVSPGPGRPEAAGIAIEAIERLHGRVPILGVCLGHQAIARAFGGRIVRAARVMHGKTSRLTHTGRGLFRGLPQPFVATRYHSLIVEPASLPPLLEVTCKAADDAIMGVRVRGSETWGVQFHPESIATPCGGVLLRNFLTRCGAESRAERAA